MDSFAFDAPDYFLDFSKDLANENISKAEAFFETEHKTHYGLQVDNVTTVNDDSGRDFDQEFFTPMKEPAKPVNGENVHYPLRKSLSMNNVPTDDVQLEELCDDIHVLSDAMDDLEMSRKTKSTNQMRKSHAMTTRSDMPKLHLRTRSISRDHLDKLAQPKRKHVSHEDLQARKYVSMAEAINMFQQKTPIRFHSKSRLNAGLECKVNGPIPTTIPQSPALATKQRARANHIVSREEQELKELEEARKFKIKANPVNPKILNGPVQLKPSIFKKPTQPEPFKLTEVHVKKPPTSPKQPEFHAKPVPKCVLAPPKPIIKSSLCTQPHTPRLMKRHPRPEPSKHETNGDHAQPKIGQPFKGMPTKLKPFSFEERDKDVQKKKEQLIHEVLEEEKKAREFHARPLPKSIFKSPQSKNSTLYYQKRQTSNGSLYKSGEDMSGVLNQTTTFKAKPARVLQMKPFEPKKNEQHLIETAEFQLSTYYRAKQREEFEQKKREKEEKLAQYMKEREELMQHQEHAEIARLRRETQHKAQPIRHYKDVKPVPVKKLTSPVSPKFASIKTKRENSTNKENLVNNA